MINLQTINNFSIKIFLFSLLFIFSTKNTFASENVIIFKLNDKAYTSFDFEKRLQYLDFVGNNENLSKKIILDDFISAAIFFEYYKQSNDKNNYEDKISEIYNNIDDVNKKNKKTFNYELEKEYIISNIKLDLIRKIILERILNSNIGKINDAKQDIDLLYKFKVKYINFNNNINIKFNNFSNITDKELISYLEDNEINYFIKEKEINNIYKIDKRIRDVILSDKNYLIINNNNKISILFIDKEFESLEGIVANIYSVRSKANVDEETLKCNNLNNENNNLNLVNKEYKFSDLNNELKMNLISINDFIKIKNNEENIYIVLCDIKFDKKLLEDLNLNKLINLNVNAFEQKFISKYSKMYNLKINE